MAQELPDCDEVFAQFFDRWYTDEDRSRRPFRATRPDAEGYESRGRSASDLSPLTEPAQARVAKQVETMITAAAHDWPKYLDVSGVPSIEWVDAFDRHFTAPRVLEAMTGSDPSDFGNDLVVFCCEFGAVLGAVLKERIDQAEWLYDWPYWESSIYDRKNGYRVNVFHWAIKKFSDYGVDDGYAAKLLATAEIASRGWREGDA